MLGRIGTTLLLVLELTSATSFGEPATNYGKAAQSDADEDEEVLEVERQIETLLSQDSEQTRKQETRRTLEMVTQQFTILDLPRSMVERNKLQNFYEILQASRRVSKGIVFDVFSGAQHGFTAFRVGDHIFVSTALFSLPDLALEGVVAHELSHDGRDYKRKVLIEMNNLGPDLKQVLKARLESRADEGAVRILFDAGRDTGAVELYLELFKKNGKLTDAEAQMRLAAARGAMRAASSL